MSFPFLVKNTRKSYSQGREPRNQRYLYPCCYAYRLLHTRNCFRASLLPPIKKIGPSLLAKSYQIVFNVPLRRFNKLKYNLSLRQENAVLSQYEAS